MHSTGSSTFIPVVMIPDTAKPMTEPIVLLKPEIAVERATSVAGNHAFAIKLIEFMTRHCDKVKMKVPVNISQNYPSPPNEKLLTQQPRTCSAEATYMM